MSEDSHLITKEEYIAALAVVKAYERQVEIIAAMGVIPVTITSIPEGWWLENTQERNFDVTPATFRAMKAAGMDAEDIGFYYQVYQGRYQGFLIPKANCKELHLKSE